MLDQSVCHYIYVEYGLCNVSGKEFGTFGAPYKSTGPKNTADGLILSLLHLSGKTSILPLHSAYLQHVVSIQNRISNNGNTFK
jgi:hypothetical protein